MRKKILTDQNNSKALELRLEQDGGMYYVVVAGITFHLQSGCSN